MGWKVNTLFLWTCLMSTYGQMVLIGENWNAPVNTNMSVTENGVGMRTKHEESNEEPTPPERENRSSENPENASENNAIPDYESSGDGDPDTEDQNRNPDIVVPPVPGNITSVEAQQSNEEQQLNEGEQSDEAQPPKEESQVARSSEQVESSVQELSEEKVTVDGVINTSHGPVQGYPWNEAQDIISYFDIPYGRVTSMFQAPERPERWEATRQVNVHDVHCPQVQRNAKTSVPEVTGHIDCLTLSVFKPKDAENADVLFHIHDGSFTSGSGDPLIYGPEYLLSRGIILVLPNYRLGPLGFLCLLNETAPGNAALKDLTLALNWTKENIAAFGGNPENIVVSGDGMSGALAGYLAISPASIDYVSKVIADSGAVVSHWAIDRNPITTATKLAEKIRRMYQIHTFNESLFQDIDMQELILGAQGINLRPCVENGSDPFITESPWYLLQNQKINMSLMIGSASFAGLHEALSHDANSISQLNNDFGYLMPDDLFFENGRDEMLKVASKVKTQYFGDSAISKNSDELALVYTDASYLGPVVRTARVLVEAGATVYFYEFAFVGALNRERTALGSEVNGSARGDIAGYLFTQEGQVPEGSKEEQMVNLMTDLWISFIHNGTPSSIGVEWNQLESTSEAEEEWLWIGSESQARKGLHLDRLQLWTTIYNEHFVERNVATSQSQSPALIVIAVSVIGLLPRSMQVSR